MPYDMRRADRMLAEEAAARLLASGEYGVLSTIGPDGYPYGVPLSYAYDDGVIYFHCAGGVGHKLANIDFNARACFTVVGATCVLPAKFSTKYESVIAFGQVKPAVDKLAALELLTDKYSPGYAEQGRQYARAAADKVGVYEFHIERVTGKARHD